MTRGRPRRPATTPLARAVQRHWPGSITALAVAAGVPRSTLTGHLYGYNRTMSLEFARRVCKAMKIKVEEMR